MYDEYYGDAPAKDNSVYLVTTSRWLPMSGSHEFVTHTVEGSLGEWWRILHGKNNAAGKSMAIQFAIKVK